MEIDVGELNLPLVNPFTITRGTQTVSASAVLRLRWNGIEGLGETAPIDRYGETIESVIADLEAHTFPLDDPYALDVNLSGLPPAARCALDIALHDLIGKDLDRPLWRLFGLEREQTPVTSFTIGIDSIDVVLERVAAVRDHPVLKIKLGRGNEIETLEAVRSQYAGAIRIDANEGWSPDQAVRILRELERFEIEFCEQPIPAGTPAALRGIRAATSIPIVADEDAKDASDLAALIGCVDGVNVKLVKTGGLRGAIAMIHTARALGMKVMLGCMVESAILATAAAHISPLVDWADLDGPFLVSEDPFSGITYDRGKIVLPDGPGLGVRETAVAA
jgi:L-alanine-DL-glutamate epimerase-like enolase superfamily enzyme